LGFAPRADVLLEQRETSRRVWVEFEISRADPVANHAKFGTARFLEGHGRENDAFVSMASRHIAAGRLALAAGAAMLMRGFGIAAFQVDLLPQLDAAAIKQLNSRPITSSTGIEVKAEIERVLRISDADVVNGIHRIHKADNPFAVAVNIRQWNAEVQRTELAALWGRRRVSYFVYDRATDLFAPSKFCAFVPTIRTAAAAKLPELLQGRAGGMTMSIYSSLGESDPRFDGHIAWKHLHRVLGYDDVGLERSSETLQAKFEKWQRQVEALVAVRSPVTLLTPPLRQ
jgi:hypothetical protein